MGTVHLFNDLIVKPFRNNQTSVQNHGRMIWDEVAMPGYGLYDRALGATYLNGLWEAIEKGAKRG